MFIINIDSDQLLGYGEPDMDWRYLTPRGVKGHPTVFHSCLHRPFFRLHLHHAVQHWPDSSDLSREKPSPAHVSAVLQSKHQWCLRCYGHFTSLDKWHIYRKCRALHYLHGVCRTSIFLSSSHRHLSVSTDDHGFWPIRSYLQTHAILQHNDEQDGGEIECICMGRNYIHGGYPYRPLCPFVSLQVNGIKSILWQCLFIQAFLWKCLDQ